VDNTTAALLSRFKSPVVQKWILCEIMKATPGDSQTSGRPQVAVELAPVVGNNPVRDLSLRAYPQAAMEGDPPDALAKIRKRGTPFIRAVDPEFPQRPHREDAGVYTVKTNQVCTDPITKETHEYAEGDTIGFTEYNRIQGAQDAMVFDALEALVSDEDLCEKLVGARLYVKPGKATYSEQYGVSQFINSFSMDTPKNWRTGDDEEIAAEDDLIDREAQAQLLAALGIDVEV